MNLQMIIRQNSIPFVLAILTLWFTFLPCQHLSADSPKITSDSLFDIDAKVKQLVAKAMPATVSIMPAGNSRRFGMGSGVVVSSDGLVLTAAHVSMEMGDQVYIIFPGGKRERGKVLGMDFSRDAGMIQILDRSQPYPFVELGDSDALNKNDWCIAMGHAGGYQHDRTPPVRLGRIIKNDPEKFIRTDSALIAGDSGGPLFDLDGRLIAIHSNIGMSLMDNHHVPLSCFQQNWQRLKKGIRFGGGFLENRDRPMIGTSLKNVKNGQGALISEILPNSPAANAGLKSGDIITHLGSVNIIDTYVLVEEINKYGAGETVQLTVIPANSSTSTILPITFVSIRKLDTDQHVPAFVWDQRHFNKRLDEAMEKNSLSFGPGEIERYGGAQRLSRMYSEYAKSLSRADRKKLERLLSHETTNATAPPIRPWRYNPDKPPTISEDFFRNVLNAFRPSNASASDATHLVFRGKQWKSLATVVHKDGYLLTKASEIDKDHDQNLQVLIAKGQLYPATITHQYPDYDLALIKIEQAPELKPVHWFEPKNKLPLGSLISAPSSSPDPAAIGVVSVQSRSLSGKNKGFLGINMEAHSRGIRVRKLDKNGNAGKAGIQPGDIIFQIDDVECTKIEQLQRKISGTLPGQDVTVQFWRGDRRMSRIITLRSREPIEKHPRGFPEHRMNGFGTKISSRATNFLNVIQTDLPIRPEECGGPVIDLQGRVIGINIARAGRIKTFVLPAADVKQLIAADISLLDDPF